MAPPSIALERILQRDRQLVTAALGLTIACAWAYIFLGAGMEAGAFAEAVVTRSGIAGNDLHGATRQWNATYAVTVIAMWWFMMVAMMLPSAVPTILLTAALNRCSDENCKPYGAAGFFTAGYLFAWMLFSVVATTVQWALENSGLLSGMMQSANWYLSGGLLLAAGLWQLTSVKQACLRHCRSPVRYLVCHRRQGNSGALVMGMAHGTHCLGCCWAMMGLLFYAGVMNLLWVAGLALYVLLEKLAITGQRLSQYTGVALMLAGGTMLVA